MLGLVRRGCVLTVLLAGCGRTQLAVCQPIGAADPPDPAAAGAVVQHVEVETIQDVDLLVMVDNSSSMREEQANLTGNLPQMVQELTEGERKARSLHVGVISSDMGNG